MAQYRTERVNGIDWSVPLRYRNLVAIGQGAFGNVCSCDDLLLRQGRVAIKRLMRPFMSPRHAERTYREIMILVEMNHDNIIRLLDIFTPQSTEADFRDIYLVTTLMDSSLSHIITTRQLTNDHIKYITYQILRALKYLHSADVIHRDLKPDNIGVNEDCRIRLLDFGLSRQADEYMTGYVITRSYRAPEVTLSFGYYDERVDVWAMGCILAEMFLCLPLFPIPNHNHHVNKIFELTGTVDAELMSKITNNDTRRILSEYYPPLPRKNFRIEFFGVIDDEQAIDLLSVMLVLDPDRRVVVEDALAHQYVDDYRDKDNEPIRESLSYTHKPGNINEDIDKWKGILWSYIHEYQNTLGNASVDRMDF